MYSRCERVRVEDVAAHSIDRWRSLFSRNRPKASSPSIGLTRPLLRSSYRLSSVLRTTATSSSRRARLQRFRWVRDRCSARGTPTPSSAQKRTPGMRCDLNESLCARREDAVAQTQVPGHGRVAYSPVTNYARQRATRSVSPAASDRRPTSPITGRGLAVPGNWSARASRSCRRWIGA